MAEDDADLLEKLQSLFFPHAIERMNFVKNRGIKFAHYTSAYAAMQILGSGELWLRNAALMNDFSEIQHGRKCFLAAWNDNRLKDRLKTLLDGIDENLVSYVAKTLDDTRHDRVTKTYMMSISEHGNGGTDEDKYGRLSM